MKKSYLIQRLKKPINDDGSILSKLSCLAFGGGLKNGGISQENMDIFKKVFSFDYMGAAEFEFGAVPETLSKMVENTFKLIKGSMTVHWSTLRWREGKTIKGNSKVYFLCYKDHKKDVKKRIASWAMGNNVSGYPKCGVRLDSSFDDHYYHGWFELDNGFFFFTDKAMWENTCSLFDLPEKKKAKK